MVFLLYDLAAALIQGRLKRHREHLLSTLECQYGLLDELYSRCLLSDQQLESIKRKKDMYKQNSALLQVLDEMDMSDLNEFFSALKATCQSHLVTYIINNGRMYNTILLACI